MYNIVYVNTDTYVHMVRSHANAAHWYFVLYGSINLTSLQNLSFICLMQTYGV